MVEIKGKAIETGIVDGHEYWIVPSPMKSKGIGGLNGYVVYEERPVRELGYDGILMYVPVHGGITYAQESDDCMVYGFDTAHHDSDSFPINDATWIKEQITMMIAGIDAAVIVEQNYLRCSSTKGKAKHAQTVWDTKGDAEQSYNFGITLNLMMGKI